MQVEQVTITPTLARRILDAEVQPNWRALRPTVVARYAVDMANGRWRDTGEALKFDEEGHLLDGQHRLQACIKAGVSFPALIVRGVQGEAVEAMDMGLKRTLADFLKREGEHDVIRLAGTIGLAWKWETSHLLDGVRPGPGEAVAWYRRHPEIVQASVTARQYTDLGIVPSTGGVFTWRATQLEPDEEMLFRHALISGEKMERGHPVLLLRNWLTVGTGREKRWRADAAVTHLAMMIKAWNAVMTGEWPKALRYGSTGMVREVFPLMVGKSGA